MVAAKTATTNIRRSRFTYSPPPFSLRSFPKVYARTLCN